MRKLLPACCVFILILAGCRSKGPPRAPAIAEAWAGPAVLKLRKEIPMDSPVAGTAKHGERVEIVQRRRRFLKVRTSSGAEGWTDENLLLSAAEIAALRDLATAAKGMPTQAVATTFDALNVHTTSSRQSPSFTQVNKGEKMDVLKHIVAPRTAPPRKPLIPPAPKKAKAVKKAAKESKYPPPPKPTPPPPPANWLALSKTNMPPEPAEPAKPVPMDDWSLVRTPGGQVGWVLTRRLFMAIPDEVAQYAEGHRITSYFALGDVQDGEEKKHNWLWTTVGDSQAGYDFDSFRVFIWSLRRHRYETAYVERRIKGYLPVQLHNVTLTSGAKRGTPVSTSYPGFSVCVEKDDGQRHLRSYAFIVNVVRFAGEGQCPPPGAPVPGQSGGTLVASNQQQQGDAAASPSLLSRMKTRIGDLARRWLGKHN